MLSALRLPVAPWRSPAALPVSDVCPPEIEAISVLLALKNAHNVVLFHTLIPLDSRGVGGIFSKNVTKRGARASPATTARPNGLGQAGPGVPPGEPQRAVDGVRLRRTGLGQRAQEARDERASSHAAGGLPGSPRQERTTLCR
jgi:hypothetical protein